eukprot:scaffold23695_cov147-Cylindrotheca_fusiformis.AAC.3
MHLPRIEPGTSAWKAGKRERVTARSDLAKEPEEARVAKGAKEIHTDLLGPVPVTRHLYRRAWT